MTNDINVVYMDLPVSEAVTPNDDGSYTIFIKETLSDDKKRDAYHHAMKHINNDDFYSDLTADQIEGYAHG